MINFLLNIFIFLNCLINNNDIEKYQSAYNFIIDSSSVINNWFFDDNTVESFSIFVSPRIYYIEKLFFTTSIIDYEFGCLDSTSKRKVERLILSDEYRNMDKHMNDTSYKYIDYLNKLNTKLDYNLKLFFSEIDEYGRLVADLIEYNEYENYNESQYRSYLGIKYLFYFENNIIKKVMILKWQI